MIAFGPVPSRRLGRSLGNSTDVAVWRRVNRPHPALDLQAILAGIARLARAFRGTLVTETMLVAGINDSPESVAGVADYLAEIGPATAYLAAPTRPPAEPDTAPPDEATLVRAYQQLSARLPRVETLIGDEGDAFASTGLIEEDLLAVTAVHPLREEAVHALLAKAGADWQAVERLLASGALRRVEYQGHRFYQRSLHRSRP